MGHFIIHPYAINILSIRKFKEKLVRQVGNVQPILSCYYKPEWLCSCNIIQRYIHIGRGNKDYKKNILNMYRIVRLRRMPKTSY